MNNSVGNIPNSYSGTAIYCNNIDISKLSPEERKAYLEKMPNVGMYGIGGGYPADYYVNNYAKNNNVYKKPVTVLTDELMQQLDMSLESNDSALRRDAANKIVSLFDEDPTRYNDKGLNVLLNKMLLNPYDKEVRGHGLTLLQSEMASGDENTRAILEELKANPQQYQVLERHLGDIDSALMHMAAERTVVYAPIKS